MWTQLKNCREGDLIKAYFLGNSDPSDPSDYNWHTIKTISANSDGSYYVAIEGFKGTSFYGTEDVYVQ